LDGFSWPDVERTDHLDEVSDGDFEVMNNVEEDRVANLH
jgi:hypothetical protein